VNFEGTFKSKFEITVRCSTSTYVRGRKEIDAYLSENRAGQPENLNRTIHLAFWNRDVRHENGGRFSVFGCKEPEVGHETILISDIKFYRNDQEDVQL
jgi:hypothetical protein